MCSSINWTIRLATEADVRGAKKIADQCRKELGFVNLAILKAAQNKDWLLVSTVWDEGNNIETIVGFVNFRIRRDKNGTLYDIAVQKEYRGKGIGTHLINHIIHFVRIAEGQYLRLKCPVGLPANEFYKKYGFNHIEIEAGKTRKLNVWCNNIQ